MVNDKIRMTSNEPQFPRCEDRHLGILSSFDIRALSFRAGGAFTIIELLVVMTIIIILAGLTLATVGYVQKKGARSRAEAEIAAISATLESYKADNGIYPRDATSSTTDDLDARSATDPAMYQAASLFLYKQLSGDSSASLRPPADAKIYFSFKPQMLGRTKDSNGNLAAVSYIRDPFGNSYGYSTAYQKDSSKGYNATYDLWSTAAYVASTSSPAPQDSWIKNW